MQAIRLVAAVIAKNAVGSSWRKTLGSREWSKVPDGEKAAVREAAARLLLSEGSHRVSMQLGLLITNIARSDYPTLSDIRTRPDWAQYPCTCIAPHSSSRLPHEADKSQHHV